LLCNPPTRRYSLDNRALSTRPTGSPGLNNPDFDFSAFYSEYAELYPKNKLPDRSFLEWLIGFYEGDGSLTTNHRGETAFIITQGTPDIQVLEFIQSQLGFGRINKQGPDTSRFIVQDVVNLRLILLLLNGNVILPSKARQFETCLGHFNAKNSYYFIVKEVNSVDKLSLRNAWLLGFTDAEGCFSCSFLKNSKSAYRLRYIVTQKGEENCIVFKNTAVLPSAGQP
jgi:hypothetical protein